MIIKDFLSNQKASYLKHLRSGYSEELKSLLPASPCIISNNCLAGFIYQDIKLPYLTPTAGLYFFFPDYIEFLSDLENNLRSEITFVNESKYNLGNQRLSASRTKYPIGLLNNKFEIHFLHYTDKKEAESKWKRRIERFDVKNLVVLGTELDLCTEADIHAFDKLQFKQKCFLTRTAYNLESVKYVEEFKTNSKIGDPYRYGHILYKNIIQKFSL